MAFNLPEQYKRLGGTVFFGERNLGTGGLASTGLRFIGDVSEFTVEPTQEFVEHQEHQTGIGFKDLKIPRMTQITGSMTLDNTGVDNLGDFLRGTKTNLVSGAVSAEAHTAPAVGRCFALNFNPSAITSITSDPAGTTYVAGTDYYLDGRVVYVPTGSSMAGDPILVNYTKTESNRVDMFAANFSEKYLLFQGINTVNQKRVTLEFYKVSFDPATIGNLLGDEVLTMTIAFEIIYEPLKSVSNLGGYGSYLEQT